MMTQSQAGSDQVTLDITLDLSHLPVSALSALLRVMQAALREVARGEDGDAQLFAQGPEPVLLVSRVTVGEDVTLHLTFVDRESSAPLRQLSSRTFKAFLERFGGFVKRLPQPSLWGATTRGVHRGEYESPLEMRMDQVRMELRRFPRSALVFKGRTIRIEGDQVQLG